MHKQMLYIYISILNEQQISVEKTSYVIFHLSLNNQDCALSFSNTRYIDYNIVEKMQRQV